ncbi:MAG: NOL1/NOP2/sun family putative RNA methylase [Candidatus Woesearchaeota archaeon]|jgi:NOL1/NOP2/sun family putative RNA methylase
MLNTFPNKDKLVMKDKFKERYQELLGEDFDTFVEYSFSFLNRAIRVNTLKITTKELVARLEPNWILKPVPWYADAFWIEPRTSGRRDIGNIPEHTLGYFYVQDPASMIPPLCMELQEDDVVLDMCSAPGSKTTEIAQLMNNKGLLIANELTGTRISALGINLTRMGVTNTVVNHQNAMAIRKDLMFTKILVDTSCSATGTIRKSPSCLRMWNPGLVCRLAKLQMKMLEVAYARLLPGGILVYSTCTLEPQENEGAISNFLKLHEDMDVLDIDLKINKGKPVMAFEGEEYDARVEKTLRIYPQDNDTEGFFVAKLKKN